MNPNEAAHSPTFAHPRAAQAHRQSSSWNRLATPVVLAVGVLVVFVTVGVSWMVWRNPSSAIRLLTSPNDAVVTVDGKRVAGTTSPFLIGDLASRETHRLEVRHEGYRPWTAELRLEPGATLSIPRVRLMPEGEPSKSGTTKTGFRLDSVPTGARVFVDGRALSHRTPIQVIRVKPGTHLVVLDAGEGYEPWKALVQVASGRIETLPKAVITRHRSR